ncbi:hypothetical protein [Paenibacillus daejeonensis]|uniref:hypothetical protein n=1 Tax=Paenibacillus daejeonensis TaxID=135193 RepID=UPI0003682DCA|nr:hypothetical protein [Paenibacillus daejeonensis]
MGEAKRYRWWLVASAVWLMFSWQPFKAEALSCAHAYEIEEAYTMYDAVIMAKVDKVRRASLVSSDNEVRLTVERSFKGIEEPELKVREDMNWGATDGPSEEGKRYLFFLNRTDQGWQNPLCAPSVELEGADDMLAYLAAYEIPVKEQEATGRPGWWLYGGLVMLVMLMLGAALVIKRRQR